MLPFAGPTEGAPHALFTTSLTANQAQQLWSPDLLPHIPYLFVLVVAGSVVTLWNAPANAGSDGRRRAGLA